MSRSTLEVPARVETMSAQDLRDWSTTLAVAAAGATWEVYRCPSGEHAAVMSWPGGVPDGEAFMAAAHPVTVYDLAGPADLALVEDDVLARSQGSLWEDDDTVVPVPIDLPASRLIHLTPDTDLEAEDRLLAAAVGEGHQVQVYGDADRTHLLVLTVPTSGEPGWRERFGSASQSAAWFDVERDPARLTSQVQRAALASARAAAARRLRY